MRFLLPLAILLFMACQIPTTEYSEILHENASVVAKIFTPSRHDVNLEQSAFNTGLHSQSWNGNTGTYIGHGLQITQNSVSEKFGILFRCQHGTFTSLGSDARHRALYEGLKEGQKVDVTYKEIYTAVYETKDGKRDMISRTLTGFDFLDAIPLESK
jgi:hypothetical protein